MTNDDKDNGLEQRSNTSDTPSSSGPQAQQPGLPPTTAEHASQSRTDLIEKARSFLISPQIRLEDIAAQRRFLTEKGLTDEEITGLLRELPVQVPPIPPRTYPQPPPSNLPNLLIGLARIFTWVTGGSAVLLFVYYRYLLPLLTHSYQARMALKSHQKGLLSKLIVSVESLKQTQTESFSVLPKPAPFEEDARYKDCHTLDQAISASNEKPHEIPPFSVLRCTIEEFAAQSRDANTEDLFQAIEVKLPWLNSEEGAQYQNDLWQTLSTHPSFSQTDLAMSSIWLHTPPTPPKPTPLLSSLSALRATLPTSRSQSNPSQYTLQTLSDFTGYLTTQIYSLPSISSYRPRFSTGGTLGPEEEEVRKEIRALKGLVLNRRSFLSTVPRSSSAPPTEADTLMTP